MALGSFGTKVTIRCVDASVSRTTKTLELDVPGMLTGRADATRKHEIELLRFANLIIGVRIFDSMFVAEGAKFWARKVIEL